jgi:hypothetical protein
VAVQETVPNEIAGLFGSTAGILAGLSAVAVLWLGAEHALNVFDINLPLRQLMFGRTWHALGLYARFICAAAVAALNGTRKPALQAPVYGRPAVGAPCAQDLPKVRRYSRGVTSSVLTKA